MTIMYNIKYLQYDIETKTLQDNRGISTMLTFSVIVHSMHTQKKQFQQINFSCNIVI